MSSLSRLTRFTHSLRLQNTVMCARQLPSYHRFIRSEHSVLSQSSFRWPGHQFTTNSPQVSGNGGNKDGNDKDQFWHQLVYNLAWGLGGGVTATLLHWWQNAEKELELVPFHGAKKIGLKQVQTYQDRTVNQEANELKKATKRLVVIGLTGNRMVRDKVLTGPNPLRAVLVNLIEKNGGEVTLLVYNPVKAKELGLTVLEVVKIHDTLSEAKKMPSYGQRFKVKMMDKFPPFHGELIDDSEANIVPIRKSGLHRTINTTMETYVPDAASPNNKFNNIEADFQKLIEEARDV